MFLVSFCSYLLLAWSIYDYLKKKKRIVLVLYVNECIYLIQGKQSYLSSSSTGTSSSHSNGLEG